MLNLLNWNKPLKVNGLVFLDSADAYEHFKDFDGEITIELNYKLNTEVKAPEKKDTVNIYQILVRQYMTKKSTPQFDFMKSQNNDIPMPYRVMYGHILEETKGMYKMELHARAEKDAVNCSRCWRKLTHPVSRMYGIGPECGGHGHSAPDSILKRIDDEEEAWKEIDKELRKITWTGWIPKKAIEHMVTVETKKVEEKIS